MLMQVTPFLCKCVAAHMIPTLSSQVALTEISCYTNKFSLPSSIYTTVILD